MSAALGMEKISVGVFVNAIMPDTTHGSSYVLEQCSAYGDPSMTSLVVRPKFISSTLYHLSSIEDDTLGTLMVRPGSVTIYRRPIEGGQVHRERAQIG
ncbi:unnamed protein product [Ilex paraguariensis]|uniref:Uncharacterized protein n=1 Tax=Ilex paraguariensis TaxID=185542 RepID=A0ABC8TEW5_9AQUA